MARNTSINQWLIQDSWPTSGRHRRAQQGETASPQRADGGSRVPMARRHQRGFRAPTRCWAEAGAPLPPPHPRILDARVAAVAAHDRKLDVLSARMRLLLADLGLLVTALIAVYALVFTE